MRGAVRISVPFRILCLGLPLILASAQQAQRPAEGNTADSMPSAYATAQSDDAAVIGADDVITIEALNVEEISKSWRVGGGGDLSLPIIGRVHAAGMRLRSAKKN
jgi:protein involved in polysaccharide export with SLBB domain